MVVRAWSPWTLGALGIVAVLTVPIAAVLSSLAAPAVDVWSHLIRTQLLELIVNTILLLAGVGLGALGVGTTLAWLVVHYRFPGRGLFEWALVLPLAMPAYVVGFAFLGLLDFAGPLQTLLRNRFGPWLTIEPRGYGGVVVAMTLVFYPYVYLLARSAFTEQGAATLETARSLGCTRGQAFRQITLPMARPALVAGTALAMMEALADFGTVATFGYRTLTEAIYRVWYGMFDRLAATQLASLLLLFALGLVVLERSLRGRARFSQSRRRGHGITLASLPGWWAVAAAVTCTVVLGVAFVLPVTQLLVWAGPLVLSWPPVPRFNAILLRTLALAAAAALLVAALAVVLAYARRLHPSTGVRLATQVAATGYALPGSVIAVGVLVPMAWLDHALVHQGERLFGYRLGLMLTGSVAGLLFAYAVRFVAVGFQTLDASLGRLPQSLDDAARSLGARVGGTLYRVHLPLLRRGLLTALILVFVETMKEMPATLLLRPFGLSTLATEVWERTSESLWAEAAVPALALVLAGLLPVFLALRLSAGPASR
ncbi:MAG: ABC transporter permease [Candidatus Rokuibacteriota bacterium]